MLVMSGLMHVTHWFLYSSITLSLPDHFKEVLDYIHVALWVLLPVTGWIAESWLGRYRAIVVGLVLSSITSLTLQTVFVMLQFDWTPIPARTLGVVRLIIGTFGFGSFYTIMLPFALDKMIGASAQCCSTVVLLGIHFCSIVGGCANECVPIPNQLQHMHEHSSSDLPHSIHSMFLSCSDNGLPVSQVARR